MNSTEKPEVGRIMDVSGREMHGVTVGMDLKQGIQRPIAIVGLHPKGNACIHIDIAQAKEIIDALKWLIEKVEKERMI